MTVATSVATSERERLIRVLRNLTECGVLPSHENVRFVIDMLRADAETIQTLRELGRDQASTIEQQEEQLAAQAAELGPRLERMAHELFDKQPFKHKMPWAELHDQTKCVYINWVIRTRFIDALSAQSEALAEKSAELERVRKANATLNDRIVALQFQVDSTKKDAERYRYAQENLDVGMRGITTFVQWNDARIDAALATPSAAGGEKEG